jgi:hypothetical protein
LRGGGGEEGGVSLFLWVPVRCESMSAPVF